jgi:hypothetical protein
MEHKPLAELQAVAKVRTTNTAVALSREQRLNRWIELLEDNGERRLRSLHEIEHLSRLERRQCRADNSPLTVAYEDPLLRAAGLRSDRIGDCTDFFELSDRQMHHAFCSCHVGFNLTGMQAADRLRGALWAGNLRQKIKAAVLGPFQAAFRRR